LTFNKKTRGICSGFFIWRGGFEDTRGQGFKGAPDEKILQRRLNISPFSRQITIVLHGLTQIKTSPEDSVGQLDLETYSDDK